MNRLGWLPQILFIAILLSTGNLLAVDKGGDWSLTGTYKISYDDNILRYSTRDREAFLDGSERYNSPIKTLDDLRNDLKFSLSYSKKFLPPLDTRVTFTANFAGYTVNSVKNFSWLSVSSYQDITKKFRLSANYFYNHEFYIRDYNDVVTGTRQACEFNLSQTRIELRYRPAFIWEITGTGTIKKYAYNEYFTQYDSDAMQYGFETVWRPNPFRFSFEYQLAINDNVGFKDASSLYSEIYNTTDSEVGQGDYQEDQFALTARYSFKFLKKNAYTQINYSYTDRYYLTDRDPKIDPIHHGRRDQTSSTGIVANITLTKVIDTEIGFEQGNRRSRASDEIVKRVKDYNRWGAWIEFSYKIW